MNGHITRRRFLATSAAAAPVVALTAQPAAFAKTPAEVSDGKPALRLGLMTYTLGKDWDVPTIIKNLKATRWEHAELRTTHGHGVEVSLSKAERQAVKKTFEDADIALSLASGFSYHWPDKEKLRANIEGTKEYTLLARGIGARGIRVFPNAILADQGIPEEQTLEQIGKAAAEVGNFAADYGVEIRLANHGRGTNRVSRVKKMIDYADSPHVYMNWNCDRSDIEDPGLEANFNSVKDRIRNIHLHDLAGGVYPYRKLFALLRASNYSGYCDAEVSQSKEPLVYMKYYRALFLALQNEL